MLCTQLYSSVSFFVQERAQEKTTLANKHNYARRTFVAAFGKGGFGEPLARNLYDRIQRADFEVLGNFSVTEVSKLDESMAENIRGLDKKSSQPFAKHVEYLQQKMEKNPDWKSGGGRVDLATRDLDLGVDAKPEVLEDVIQFFVQVANN